MDLIYLAFVVIFLAAAAPEYGCERLGRSARPVISAIYSYNPAESHGLAISHLADRLPGHPPLRTPGRPTIPA
jgi:hypothetical protein